MATTANTAQDGKIVDRFVIQNMDDLLDGPPRAREVVIEGGDAHLLTQSVERYPNVKSIRLWDGHYGGSGTTVLSGLSMSELEEIEVIGAVVGARLILATLRSVNLCKVRLVRCTIDVNDGAHDGGVTHEIPKDLVLEMVSMGSESVREVFRLFSGTELGKIRIAEAEWFEDSDMALLARMKTVKEISLKGTSITVGKKWGEQSTIALRELLLLELDGVVFGDEVALGSGVTPKLNKVVLRNCVLTQAFIEAVSRSPEIKVLEVRQGTEIRQEWRELLAQVRPELVID